VIVPAELNVRLDPIDPPPDCQVPVPFIVMVCPVIMPVPVFVRLEQDIPFVARVAVIPVATESVLLTAAEPPAIVRVPVTLKLRL
jgi:hypothetical protein